MTADNILQFKPKTEAVVDTNPFLAKPPQEAAGTDGYVMSLVNYSHVPLKTVPDIANASIRNKKWGAVFSIGILSELDKQPKGPAAVPQMPSQFFDGDSLDALRSRLIHEIDKAIALAKIQSEDPAKYAAYEEEYYTVLTGKQAPKE